MFACGSNCVSCNILMNLQAAADGDLDYVEKLLNKAAEFASTTKVHLHDLLRECGVDGWNMLHAAVVYKKIDVILKIFEYGTGSYEY